MTIDPHNPPLDLFDLAALKLIEQVPDPDRQADLRAAYEERAAICEYDGGLSRFEAEKIAFRELRQALSDQPLAE